MEGSYLDTQEKQGNTTKSGFMVMLLPGVKDVNRSCLLVCILSKFYYELG